MRYAKITNGTVEKYPYTPADVVAENPQTSFPQEMPDTLMLEYGATPVADSVPPPAPPGGSVIEVEPLLVNGAWTRAWSVAAAPIPDIVSARQARLALLQGGILASVEAMIAQQDEATRIAWEYATEFRRSDPLLAALAQNLGLSEAQIDQFFATASGL